MEVVYIDKFALLTMGSMISFFLIVFIGMMGWYLKSINISLRDMASKFDVLSTRLGKAESNFVNWPACRDIQTELKRRIENLEGER